MYCDDIDHKGLMYWYKDIEQQHKEFEAKKNEMQIIADSIFHKI